MKPRDKPGNLKPLEASDWVIEHAQRIRNNGTVLDLAAGRGRHSRFLLSTGHAVVAVDRDVDGLADLADNPKLEVVEADLENAPWPLEGRIFDGVVVTNYLWRPLLPKIRSALAPGGVLIYETFGLGNEKYGRPSNPDFLLQEGELPRVFSDFDIVAYEHGYVDTPKPAIIQKICAIKPG